MLDPDKIKKLDLLTRSALAAAAGICAAAPLYSPLTIDLANTLMPLLAFVAMVSIGILYQPRFRNVPTLAQGAMISADLIAYALVLGTLSYIAAASPRPLIHAFLAEIDRSLHFDWLAYYGFVKAKPDFAALLTIAYNGMIAQLGLVALVLFWIKDIQRLRVLLDAFALCALLAIAISAVFPALEALAYFKIYPLVATGAGYATGIDRVDDFLALHYGTTRIVPIMDAKGIVCFPSFHTACAVLSAVCAWPRRWLFWPALAWSSLLIAATPVDGGHYLADIITGFALASTVLAAIFAFSRARHPQPTLVLAAMTSE
jgi:membrane-associated phospholipid phosphatase